ncbi:MAG: DUF3291 domain-containing protein [Armatimonadetes bacterium]|nr:DUF3291 domain-containing protein [Armatimonadota bacterium]
MRYHLAQANIALMKAGLNDPAMSSMAERIGEMNALAERSQGFVWRFQTAEEPEIYLRPFEDHFPPGEWDRIFFNMSVWETVEDLKHYVYRTTHLEMLNQKDHWIAHMDRPHLALWWIPAGQTPTIEAAKEKLDSIEARGATPEAFTFRSVFPPPSSRR